MVPELDVIEAENTAKKLQADFAGLEKSVVNATQKIFQDGDAVAALLPVLIAHKRADGTSYFNIMDEAKVKKQLQDVKPYLQGLMDKIDVICAD